MLNGWHCYGSRSVLAACLSATIFGIFETVLVRGRVISTRPAGGKEVAMDKTRGRFRAAFRQVLLVIGCLLIVNE